MIAESSDGARQRSTEAVRNATSHREQVHSLSGTVAADTETHGLPPEVPHHVNGLALHEPYAGRPAAKSALRSWPLHPSPTSKDGGEDGRPSRAARRRSADHLSGHDCGNRLWSRCRDVHDVDVRA